MSIKKKLQVILEELSVNTAKVNESQVEEFVQQIINAKHIFIAGAGRSGLAINGFANRLLHLGFSVSIIGEISSPHSKKRDLLIIGSGSGETGSLISLAQKASNNGVNICTITMNENSSIANIAQSIVKIPGQVKTQGNQTSVQPMGTLFEQSCALFYDATVLFLMEKLHETSETMFGRHADLE